MRALIVDDDFLNRLILEKIVSVYFETDLAVNGKEAVEAFSVANNEGKPYDVILLDMMMPVMDGNEALMEIRKIESSLNIDPEKEVKVVMVTALDTPQLILDSFLKFGCSSFIVKPVEKKILLDELKKLGII